jgi:hypothetical protein
MMKQCSKCHIEQTINAFYKKGIGKRGQVLYESHCYNCKKNDKKEYCQKTKLLSREEALKNTDLTQIKICNRCKKAKQLYEYYFKCVSLRTGKAMFLNHCKHCSIDYTQTSNRRYYSKRIAYNKQRYWSNPEYFKQDARKRYKTPFGLYSLYRKNATKRNICFNLTFEQFMSFWNQPCYYCKQTFELVGIDRQNNNTGYVIENCVSCCKKCNQMKMALSVDAFYTQCRLISKPSTIEPYTFIA